MAHLSDLKQDGRNARRHSPRNLAMIEESIQRNGFGRSILLANDGTIIAGNATYESSASAGLDDVIVVETDGTKVVAVKRTDVAPGSEQFHHLALADNRAAELAEWDETVLAELNQEIDLSAFFWDDELNRILATLTTEGKTDPDAVPEVNEATTKPGDLWLLGRHRVLCGDARSVPTVQRLLNGAKPDLILTDPPYCSGGFQESGKSAGSVGTDAPHKQIANDRLSTRGYQALLKQAFENIGASYIYAFTDWRMWVWLFDIVESNGYGVRSMIVWDKGTPGMGRGWRAQHELILWGTKATPPFDKHASGVGNVLACSRTGNVHHTTEKPVELLTQLLGNTPFVETVADPFLGSGTTLIAAEQLNRTCYGMEIDPHYCDIIVRRWEDFTGQKAVLDAA